MEVITKVTKAHILELEPPKPCTLHMEPSLTYLEPIPNRCFRIEGDMHQERLVRRKWTHENSGQFALCAVLKESKAIIRRTLTMLCGT